MDIDSAEKPSVHPSGASEPVLSLTKERTDAAVETIGDLSVHAEPVEAFLGFFSRIDIIRMRQFLFAACCLSLVFFVLACWRPAGFGIGGRYLDAKAELTKRTGDLDKAIANLEYVVTRDALYQDSLTLLGRAYYKKGRHRDAFQVLTRALAVNQDDEIAWIMLGVTQLRLNDDAKGLESLKGGLTLLSQVSKDGYRGIDVWDRNSVARVALRRAVFAVTKGLEDKPSLIATSEALIARIDDEEWYSRGEQLDKLTKPD